MTSRTLVLNLTQEESALYNKCKAGQRAGSWGTHLVTALEHHGEQETFRSLLTKLRDSCPYNDEYAKKTHVARSLKTTIQELDRFDKAYPSQIAVPMSYPPERLASLEGRVTHLESELRKVYDYVQEMRQFETDTPPIMGRRRSFDRPRSPGYSPFHPPSTPQYSTTTPTYGQHDGRW